MKFVTNSYVVLHTPTKQWVKFERDQEYDRLNVIVLTENFVEAEKFSFPILAKTKLQNSYMFDQKYGRQNFLEFEVVEFKTTYTIEQNHE
jgi:hypothetical protein